MEEEKGFQIRDRRIHSAEGTDQEDSQKGSREASKEKVSPEQKTAPEEGSFPVNFSSFILSLATSALIHLGEEANPATGEKSLQLPMARQVIDLISLLEEKTKGNLTEDESSLVSQLLFTLRMKYVETEKKRRP